MSGFKSGFLKTIMSATSEPFLGPRILLFAPKITWIRTNPNQFSTFNLVGQNDSALSTQLELPFPQIPSFSQDQSSRKCVISCSTMNSTQNQNIYPCILLYWEFYYNILLETALSTTRGTKFGYVVFLTTYGMTSHLQAAAPLPWLCSDREGQFSWPS